MATKPKTKSNGHKKAAKRKANGKIIKLADGKARAKKPNKLHDTLISLMSRPTGATIHDTWNAGFYFPVMAAVKIAERRGLKVKKDKKPGELTRYIAHR